jgi:GntR family transcriptional regulator
MPWGTYGDVGYRTATVDHVTIDHDGMTPVYRQLAGILREGIERGDYAPGRKLPSEATLMQEHDLARETVRKAVRVLADEGLATVVQGRGVFVIERP